MSAPEPHDPRIPRGARLFLRLVLDPRDRDCALSDLDEEFETRVIREGPRAARRWYRSQVRHSILPALGRRWRRDAAFPASRHRLMLADDLRHAWRRVRARPTPAVMALCLLALGIGASTSTFTVVDAMVIRPIPFRDPDRLFRIHPIGLGRGGIPPGAINEWRSSSVFSGVELASSTHSTITDSGGGVRQRSARVTPGLFRLLGAHPVRGRLFTANEGRPGTDDRVILSASLWRTAFGSDPSVLGRRIDVDGTAMLVVGVMPADFRFPDRETALWMPLDDPAPAPIQIGNRIYARVAAGVPLSDAVAVGMGQTRRYIDLPATGLRFTASPLIMTLDVPTRRAFELVGGAVALLFLVLCANVTSLLLGQLMARQREFAMCSALGASRGRLLRQVFVEQVALGLTATVLGLGLAWGLVSIARGLVPTNLLARTLNPIDLDARALVAASVLGLILVILCGVLPAWIGARTDPATSLGIAGRPGTETRGTRLVTRGLLIGEIALACTLLIGATLLVRSFINLATADRGLDAHGVLTMDVPLFGPEFPDAASRLAAARAIRDHLAAMPGINEAAISNWLSITEGMSLVSPRPFLPDTSGATPVALAPDAIQATAGFFRLYRIPILLGRVFRPGDGPRDVIVGERLASALWPDENPVGRSFRTGGKRYQVIGLAREITFPTLDRDRDRPEYYTPFDASRGDTMVSLRCAARCPPATAIARRLAEAAPALSMSASALNLQPLNDSFLAQLAEPRATATASLMFAGLALVTAAAGLFAVLALAVRRRRREFGIRAALGASPRQLQRTVIGDALGVTAAGLTGGAALAWILARFLTSLEYGVTPADPLTWLTVLAAVGVTAVVASWRPARQAMTVDPVELLRAE